jgi:hypothetical protein
MVGAWLHHQYCPFLLLGLGIWYVYISWPVLPSITQYARKVEALLLVLANVISDALIAGSLCILLWKGRTGIKRLYLPMLTC